MVSRVRMVSTAVGLVLLLGGCGTKLAGTAAVVAGTTIPESAVSARVNEVRHQIESMPKESAPQIPSLVMLNQMVLSHMVLESVLEKGLAAQGVTVTDAEVAAFTKSIFAQYGQQAIEDQVAVGQGISREQLAGFMRMVYSEQALGAALAPTESADAQAQAMVTYLGTISRGLDIKIAPRFGAWNPNKLQVAPGDMTLSQPAPVVPTS